MSTMFTTDDGNDDEVRNLRLRLGTATVNETEDFGPDEIYVTGQMLAVSPSKGVVATKVFPKAPANIVRFSTAEDFPRLRTQQLLPEVLFEATLPSDTIVDLKLLFVDADDDASEEDSFTRDLLDVLDTAFRGLDGKLASLVLPAGSPVAPLLDGAGNLVADLLKAGRALDGDDALDVVDVRFPIRAPRRTKNELKANDDGADYDWHYFIEVTAPGKEEETENATGDTGTPVTPPTGGKPLPELPPKDDRSPTGDGDTGGAGGGTGGSGTGGNGTPGDDDDRPAGDDNGGRPTPVVPRPDDGIRRLRPVGELGDREEVVAVGNDLRRTIGTVGTIEDRGIVRVDDVTVAPVGGELGTRFGENDQALQAGFPNGRRVMIDIQDGLDVIVRPSPLQTS